MSDLNDVKDNLTGILMSANQGVCPTDVDDISDALTLIEQLQQWIEELQQDRDALATWKNKTEALAA